MNRTVLAVLAVMLLAGCAGSRVQFRNPFPEEGLVVPAVLYRPAGEGPFPAVVLLHGCHGVLPTTHEWGLWLSERGYAALVVDSWTPRGIATGLREGCRAEEPDLPARERFLDALGGLRYLLTRADIAPERIGVIGWSNGGAFAIATVSNTRLERARAAGINVPLPGFQASIAFYPGGCRGLLNDRLASPLLVLIGDADDWTLAGPCADMVAAMRTRGGPATIVQYPGAYHYFDVAGQAKTWLPNVGNLNTPTGSGATVSYNQAADTNARTRTLEFLTDHLRPR